MLTEIKPDAAALDLLEKGEHHAAHLVLREAFDQNPKDDELARLANMIAPCQMIPEAKDGLRRRLASPTPTMTAEQHNAFPKGRW